MWHTCIVKKSDDGSIRMYFKTDALSDTLEPPEGVEVFRDGLVPNVEDLKFVQHSPDLWEDYPAFQETIKTLECRADAVMTEAKAVSETAPAIPAFINFLIAVDALVCHRLTQRLRHRAE
jgi:hypothetical protein